MSNDRSSLLTSSLCTDASKSRRFCQFPSCRKSSVLPNSGKAVHMQRVSISFKDGNSQLSQSFLTIFWVCTEICFRLFFLRSAESPLSTLSSLLSHRMNHACVNTRRDTVSSFHCGFPLGKPPLSSGSQAEDFDSKFLPHFSRGFSEDERLYGFEIVWGRSRGFGAVLMRIQWG